MIIDATPEVTNSQVVEMAVMQLMDHVGLLKVASPSLLRSHDYTIRQLVRELLSIEMNLVQERKVGNL